MRLTMSSNLEVRASVCGRAITWELFEVQEPSLLPLVPEDPYSYGEEFDTNAYAITSPNITKIERKRAA
jgi:hypothetical protein